MVQKAETGFFGFARPKNLPRSLLKYLSDLLPASRLLALKTKR